MSDLIFEVIDGDKNYKIYRNGKTEGFSKKAVIVNHLFSIDAQKKAIDLLKKQKGNDVEDKLPPTVLPASDVDEIINRCFAVSRAKVEYVNDLEEMSQEVLSNNRRDVSVIASIVRRASFVNSDEKVCEHSYLLSNTARIEVLDLCHKVDMPTVEYSSDAGQMVQEVIARNRMYVSIIRCIFKGQHG